MSGDIITVGIAGLGRSGYNIHTRCLADMDDRFRIVAAADELPERRDDLREQFDCAVYEDYAEMLDAGGFDLFIDALPSFLHAPGTISALGKGMHVVCEKPLAGCAADVDRMAAAATGSDRVLAPFQNNRLQPFFDKMREVLASGKLGEIIAVRSVWGGFRRRWDWQTMQKNMGGALFNTGPHAVDQAIMLFGEDREPEVFCRMNCNNPFGGDADDFCALTLFDRERTAPQIEVLITAYMPFGQGEMYNVQGTHGGLTGGATKLTWRYFDPETAPKQEMWPRWSEDRAYPVEDLDWIEERWTLEEEEQKNAVGYTLRSFASGPRRFYENLYEVLHGREELLITVPQVRRQIAVIEECHRQNPLPKADD